MLEAGPPRLERATDYARQIAYGLAAAHQGGICHGDLKPVNAMITQGGVAKILDFGLARREAGDSPSAQVDYDGIAGTLNYLSPEQLKGEPATAASDVFAFGWILFEMLTGRPAIAGETISETVEGIRNIDRERRASQVAPPFDRILSRPWSPTSRNVGSA